MDAPVSPLQKQDKGSATAEQNSSKKQSVFIQPSSPANVTKTGQAQLKSDNQQNGGHNNILENPEWWLVVWTFILVYVTARLAFYTKKLWSATVGIASDAKATSERQAIETQKALALSEQAATAAKDQASHLMSAERAHLLYRDFKVTDMRTAAQRIHTAAADGGSIEVTMGIHNFGRTPAWIIEGWSQATLTNEALKCADLKKN